MTCQVGPTNADIAGLGIIISFAFQAGISLFLSYYSLFLWRSAIISPGRFVNQIVSDDPDELAARTANQEEETLRTVDTTQVPTTSVSGLLRRGGVHAPLKKKCIDKLLATIADIQLVNAMGLLIAALFRHKTMSLYHLRVVYDTVSFTTIPACASIVGVSAGGDNLKRTRLVALAIYSYIFISFSAVFGTKLSTWDEKLPGRCYKTRPMITPGHTIPLGDMIYLGITCYCSIAALTSCWMTRFDSTPLHRDPPQFYTAILKIVLRCIKHPPLRFSIFYLLFHPKAEYRVWGLIPLAMAQYPLHLYMVITVRKDNERFLEGDSENDWGFGQIVALVACTATCIECIRSFSEYRKAVRVGPFQRARRYSA